MFTYIPKSMWFPTSVDTKQAATIEELLKLCKAGEVERVMIPFTYYGYGATLIDDSNRRSITRHYRQARFKSYGYALTMSASQFIRNEHYRELIEELQEQYPVFDEQDYSQLETETKLEELVRDLGYALADEPGDEWTPERIEEVLTSGDWKTNIEWWEYAEIDSDGYTVYIKETDIPVLVELVKARALEMKRADELEAFKDAGNVELPGL